jgi:hypothetical protein
MLILKMNNINYNLQNRALYVKMVFIVAGETMAFRGYSRVRLFCLSIMLFIKEDL